MDLSLIKPVDTLQVGISHPLCRGVVFTLAGPCHQATLAAERERMEVLMAQRRRGAVDAEEVALRFLAARVIGWEQVEWEGQPLECTRENVLLILRNDGVKFIREQLLAALGDETLHYKSI